MATSVELEESEATEREKLSDEFLEVANASALLVLLALNNLLNLEDILHVLCDSGGFEYEALWWYGGMW